MKTSEILLKLRGNQYRSVVSRKTGIHHNTIKSIEQGGIMPGFDKIIKLADYYGVTTDELKPTDKDLEDLLYKEE